jgi:integrase
MTIPKKRDNSGTAVLYVVSRISSPALSRGRVSLERGEIILRAEHTKDRENRILPISNRLRRVLEMRRNNPADVPFPGSSYVFGNQIGQRVRSVRRASPTTVMRAHGHKPVDLEEEARP